MSYLVLARKYRPKIFSELIGQPHIKETLSNAITSNRLAQAYLFTGSRGTGKTTTARILAKCLNCLNGMSITPCGKCSSCEEIAGGYSMDVIEIDGASNRGIDEIRELRERVKFLPAKAKYKVYIIDEVHMLTNEAFNALLKTLEEPPPHVIFVFATTEPHKVPQTILSRCQRFDFKRIPISEICKLLKYIAEEEKIEIDDLTLISIAKAAEGSMRDAESILDQVVSYCGDKVSQEDVVTILGIVKQEVLFTFCEAIIAASANKIIQLLNEIIDKGLDLSQFVRELMMHLRNLLIIKTGCRPDSVIDLTSEGIKLLESQSSQLGQEQLLNLIEALQKANENMRLFPLQARLILEIALIKMIQGNKPRIEEVKQEVVWTPPKELFVKEPIEEVKAPVVTPSKEFENQSLEFSLEQIKNIWPEIRKNIKNEKPALDTCLALAEITDLVNQTIIIGFKRGDSFHKERIERLENKDFIQEQLKKITNCNLHIKTIFIDGASIEEGKTVVSPKVLDMVFKVFPEAQIIEG
ncbi:MAG: DNA polymerase III subunit gamma/tau [bacterium]